MADMFSRLDAKSLLYNKHILYLGDSNMRAQYKDLVWLLNFNTLIPNGSLRSKLEPSYIGDTLVQGSKLHHGRDFREVRKYLDENNQTMVEYMFIPRCYNQDLEDLFGCYKRDPNSVPDVVVINSCLWDLTRWGPNGVPQYKDNMVKVMRLMTQSLPKECLVIWTTALPTAADLRGGLIIKQIEFVQPLVRFELMEANTFAREIVVNHRFDVLDHHYHMRMQIHRRAKDGIHYNPIPMRLLTNLLLTHLSLSWGVDLPGNTSSLLLDKAIALDSNPTKPETPVKIPNTRIFSKNSLPSTTTSKPKGLRITFNTEDSVGGIAARRCNLSGKEQVGVVTEQPQVLQQFGQYSWHQDDQPSSLPQGQRYTTLKRYWDQTPLQVVLPGSHDSSHPNQRRHGNERKDRIRKNPYRRNSKK